MTQPAQPPVDPPTVQVDADRMLRSVGQLAAAALVDAWVEAAQQEARLHALLQERNAAARSAEAAAADAKRAAGAS